MAASQILYKRIVTRLLQHSRNEHVSQAECMKLLNDDQPEFFAPTKQREALEGLLAACDSPTQRGDVEDCLNQLTATLNSDRVAALAHYITPKAKSRPSKSLGGEAAALEAILAAVEHRTTAATEREPTQASRNVGFAARPSDAPNPLAADMPIRQSETDSWSDDPCRLRYGQSIMLRSCSAVSTGFISTVAPPPSRGVGWQADPRDITASPPKLARTGRANQIDAWASTLHLDGFGTGHVSETFQIINAEAQVDRGGVCVGDHVMLRSGTTDQWIGVDPHTGNATLTRVGHTAGRTEVWILRRLEDVLDGNLDDLQRRSQLAASRAEALQRLSESRASGSQAEGMDALRDFEKGLQQAGIHHSRTLSVQNCATVLLQSATLTRLFLQVGRGYNGETALHVGSVLVDAGRDFSPGEHSAGTAASSWVLVDARTPVTPSWALQRRFLRGSAVAATELQYVPPAGVRRQQLADHPAAVQEIVLVEELLSALLGSPGKYIVSTAAAAHPEGGDDAVDRTRLVSGVELDTYVIDSLGFELDVAASGADQDDGDITKPPRIASSLITLLIRLLPIATHYVRIMWFLDHRSRPENGTVAQALCAAARTVMREYTLLVAQLETTFRNGLRAKRPMGLQQLWYHLRPSLHVLRTVDQALEASARATGGRLLSNLIRFAKRSGDADARELADFLLVSAAKPYMVMLSRWLFEGVIEDRYDEFMVLERQDISKETMAKDFNSEYWTKRYQLRPNQQVDVLEGCAEQMLSTGKQLNALRECGKVLKPPYSEITFVNDARHFAAITQEAHRYASNALLNHLMETSQLKARLQSIRSYFLLQQGDYVVHFMEIADDELTKAVMLDHRFATSQRAAINRRDFVTLSRLESLLELSVRTSAAAADPFKEELLSRLEETSLLDHMIQIQSQAASKGAKSKQLQGYEAFTLDYNAAWPLSIVISRGAITKYQLVFRQLFYIKFVERQVCAAWIDFQMMKEIGLSKAEQARHIGQDTEASRAIVAASQSVYIGYALRQRMLHFLQNLLYYMQVEVIEPHYHRLVSQLGQAKTVEDVIHVHDEFLNTMLSGCLLTNNSVLNTIVRLIKLCGLFAARVREHLHLAEMDDEEAASAPGSKLSRAERHRLRLNVQREQLIALLSEPEWVRIVEQSAENFERLIKKLMIQLSDRGAAEYGSHLRHLLTRLDYNGYYSRSMDLHTSRAGIL